MTFPVVSDIRYFQIDIQQTQGSVCRCGHEHRYTSTLIFRFIELLNIVGYTTNKESSDKSAWMSMLLWTICIPIWHEGIFCAFYQILGTLELPYKTVHYKTVWL